MLLQYWHRHQWHLYPAVNAARNIKDDLLKGIAVINSLKLRAGYGETSNQLSTLIKLSGFIKYHSPYNYGKYFATSMYVTQPPNPSLGWEFSKTFNYGIDFSLC